MTVEAAPLQVTMLDEDGAPAQLTPPWVYVAVGPNLPVLVAMELAGELKLAEDPPAGSQPVVLDPDDPRNQFLPPPAGSTGGDNGLWCYWWSNSWMCP